MTELKTLSYFLKMLVLRKRKKKTCISMGCVFVERMTLNLSYMIREKT